MTGGKMIVLDVADWDAQSGIFHERSRDNQEISS
jgi:hypothetical protein